MGITALPVALTPLVGRRAEVAQIAQILQEPATRLLTLTGVGGTGKTRLALAVAEEVRFPDGVVHVELASIADPADVPGEIAAPLGLREGQETDLFDRLVDQLRPLDCLVVLDNVEHLLPEAARLVATLLKSCPSLTILATSRQPLHVTGEREYPVPPLAVPPAQPQSMEQLGGVESVRLFVERAKLLRPEFALTPDNATTIAQICARLDGLPLAVELAASRVKALSLDDLLARMDRRLALLTGGPVDAPKRQRALRDTIAWSYGLLAPAEQRLFRRLAVFAGGFTLEAAEAVAQGPGDGEWRAGQDDLPIPYPPPPVPPSVLDGLSSLVDRSLLNLWERPGQPARYGMLETLREFALDRLTESGEEKELRRRHADWYLRRLEEVWTATIHGPVRAATLNWAEAEHDNLRAALSWFDESGDVEGLLRFVPSLWPFWEIHNHLTEWRTCVDRCVPLADRVPLPVRARFYLCASFRDRDQPDQSRTPFLRLAMAAFEDLGDEWGVAVVLQERGRQALLAERYDEASDLLKQADDTFERLGNADWHALTVWRLGVVAFGQHDLDRAQELFERSLALNRALDDHLITAWALNDLALIALERGRRGEAVDRMGEALRLLRATGDTEGLTSWLALAAMLANVDGRPELAARLFGARDAAMHLLGFVKRPPRQAVYDRTLAQIRSQLGGPASEVAYRLGLATELGDAVDQGETALSGVAAAGAPSKSPSGLTPRELDVLRGIAAEQTDREIAESLFISQRTVTTHVGNILAKLGVRNRAGAVRSAAMLGLLPAPESPGL